MSSYRMRFIIGKLTDEEIELLKRGEPLISKMLLIPDDFQLFHYKPGDKIEVETHDGNRIWTIIRNMEIIEDPMHVIIIFTLTHESSSTTPGDNQNPYQE